MIQTIMEGKGKEGVVLEGEGEDAVHVESGSEGEPKVTIDERMRMKFLWRVEVRVSKRLLWRGGHHSN